MMTDSLLSDSDQLSENTALFHALRRKSKDKTFSEDTRLKEIEECINNGADINAVDKNDSENTLLHLAVKKRYESIVKFLLQQSKINIHIANKYGKTAKDIAQDLNYQTIIQSFVEYEEISFKRKYKDSSHNRKTNTGKANNQENCQKRKSSSKTDDTTPYKKAFLDDLTVPSEGIKLAEHGNIFQLKLLMLCLWRAAHTEENNQSKYKEFRLATEMGEAQKFDDIAFQYKEHDSDKWKFRLIQAKHKEGDTPLASLPKIKIGDLLSIDDDESFGLQKYFHSYLKVRERACKHSVYSTFSGSEIEDVIIITNTSFNSEKEENIFKKDCQDIKVDALLKTDTSDTCVYKLINDNNIVINKLKIIFENQCDFHKLIESIAQHMCYGKKIEKQGVFKEYYYCLIKEVLKIDIDGKGKGKKYFGTIDNFLKKKCVNGKELSEEAYKIRDALIKEISFRKGIIKIPTIDIKFGQTELPNDEKELKALAIKVAEFIEKKKKFTVQDFDQYHVALAKKVINVEKRQLRSDFNKEPFTTQTLSPLGLFKKYFIESLRVLNNKIKQINKHLNSVSINISDEFGITNFPSDEENLKELSKQLAQLIKHNKEISAGDFPTTHIILAKEVINIETKTFHKIFVNGEEKKESKVKVLTPEIKKFRRLLLDEIDNSNIKIILKDQERTIKELDEDTSLLTKDTVFISSRIQVSEGFTKVLLLEQNPEIDNIDLFAHQIGFLISQNEDRKVIEINDNIKMVLNINDDGAFKSFNNNIEKLAGYCLIYRFNKIRFSTAFLNWRSDNLPDNIKNFRTKLIENLEENQLKMLYEFEFKFAKTLSRYEDGELYRKLPTLHSDVDVNQFFSKLKFIVNYPNRKVINDLLGPEIKDKIKTLDSSIFQSSYYENLHNWMADRVGTFYTVSKTKELFQQIKDNLLPWTVDGFNKPFFADSSQDYHFKKYNILNKFLRDNDKQVLELVCKDLYLGHTRIVQEFQLLQVADARENHEYTRHFGYIFLYLNQLRDSYFSSKVYEILGDRSKFNLIVIVCNGQPQDIGELYNNKLYCHIDAVIMSNRKKKVIFITTQANNALAKKFQRSDKYQSKVDESDIYDLTEESQEKLLELEIIFKGENIPLKKLIGRLGHNVQQVINTQTLVHLMKGITIEVGCNTLGMSDLAGSYSDLYLEVNIETFVDELVSQNSRDIFIISGIPGLNKQKSLLFSINSMIEEIDESSKVNLENCIEVLKQDITRDICTKAIQISYDDFKEKDFKQICHNNPERKINWVKWEKKGDKSKFILEKIYNPNFYLKVQRFNMEVVIEMSIIEQLANEELTEIFIIRGREKIGIKKWPQFTEDVNKKSFENNCKHNKIKFLNTEDDLEVTFNEMLVQNKEKTIHLLEFKQDHLVCSLTHGSLKNLAKYRTKDYQQIVPLIEEDELIKKIIDKKVVIIAGDPGVGKSTAVVKLYNSKCAIQSGQEDLIVKSHWVIRVILKDNLRVIRNIDFNISDEETAIIKKISRFLLTVSENLSSNFARAVLDMALTSPHFEKPLLIVFDGFDEVLDQTDRDKIITLFTHLKNKTLAKFWVTTRLHSVETLENTLATFAIKIEPMDEKITRQLIKKYLKDRLTLMFSHIEFKKIFDSCDLTLNTRLSEYIQTFLNKIKTILKGDVTKFIGTPLQLYLMLENSAGHFKQWMQKNNGNEPDFSYLGDDILEVYENFVNRKYETYFQKEDVSIQLRQEQDKKTLDEYCKNLVKSLILPSNPKKSLETFKDIVLASGIVRSDGKNIDFIHPTFREYFAAKVFIDWIRKWKEGSQYILTNLQKQEFFFKKILVESDYKVIREFLNIQLSKEHMENMQLQQQYYDQVILFTAVKEISIGIASFVLDNFLKADVNANTYYGTTVLEIAASSGNLNLVKFLINRGANIKGDEVSVLHYAVASLNLDVVKLLVDKGADVNTKDSLSRPVLQIASNVEIVEFLVNEKGADVNAANKLGMSVLHSAVQSDMFTHGPFGSESLKIVEVLINKGANVHAEDEYGRTVLHNASGSGNLGIVKLLVEKGANVNAVDKYGRTVLHYSDGSGDLGIVKFLVHKGANVCATDKDGTSVLHRAAEFETVKMVEFLVNKGANVHAKDNAGRTALHSAARTDIFSDDAASVENLGIVTFLVDNGVDVNAKDKDGKSALYEAAGAGNVWMVDFLLSKGADFNATDNDGCTVLQNAAKYGQLDTVQCLVEYGKEDITLINTRECKYYSQDIIDYLKTKQNIFSEVCSDDANESISEQDI